MSEELTYNVEEFFYDKSFDDYDEEQRRQAKKKAQDMCVQIGKNIYIILCNKQINIEKFATDINVKLKYAEKILKGKIDIDLKLLCKIEAYLEVKLIRWAWEKEEESENK